MGLTSPRQTCFEKSNVNHMYIAVYGATQQLHCLRMDTKVVVIPLVGRFRKKDGNVIWRRVSARKGRNSTSGTQFSALPLVNPVVWFARAVVNRRSHSVAKEHKSLRINMRQVLFLNAENLSVKEISLYGLPCDNQIVDYTMPVFSEIMMIWSSQSCRVYLVIVRYEVCWVFMEDHHSLK